VDIVRAPGHVTGLRNRRYVVTTRDNFYESRRLLLATGSLPAMPDAANLDKARETGFAVSPRELLNIPASMSTLISGGTVNDLRTAAWLAANRVSVVLTSPGKTPAEELDFDLTDWLLAKMPSVRFIPQASVVSFGAGRVTLSQPQGGTTVRCEKVVLGGRRRPGTRGMGLSGAAIALDGSGAVVTDLTGRTNLPDVFAAGDVNGRTQTALGAFLEAELCVSNMLGGHASAEYHKLPYILDCGFKAASVGKTEQSAGKKNYKSITVPILNDKEDGFVKLIQDDGERLIGAHLCHIYEDISVIYKLAKLIDKPLTEATKITPDSLISEAIVRAASTER
jgi:dihydrolipoamide dehydrogenase